MVSDASSNLQIGTVIDFRRRKSTVADKLFEKGNSGWSG
jgi:hypothetical protein